MTGTLQHPVMVGTYCPGAQEGPDGRCPNCGRRSRFEEQWGRVVHVRGRVAGVSPYRRPIPDRIEYLRIRRCPDCDAALQETARGQRCPWARSTRQRRLDDGAIACDWPYSNPDRRHF